MANSLGSVISAVKDVYARRAFLSIDGQLKALDRTISTVSQNNENVLSHADLNDLDYASSGHTGFASSASVSSVVSNLAAHEADVANPHTVTLLQAYTASPVGTPIIRGLSQDTSQQDNDGLGFNTTLHTYSVAAGALGVNGDSVEFEYRGTAPSTSADSRIQVVFGSTTVFDSGAWVPLVTGGWVINGRIVRTGAATQKVAVFFKASNNENTAYQTAAETLSGALDLKLMGNGTNSGDVIKEWAVINFRGAA